MTKIKWGWDGEGMEEFLTIVIYNANYRQIYKAVLKVL